MLTVELDDEVLAHLQMVLSAKLRRGESFFLSWRDGRDTGGGRSAVWVDPALHVMFTFARKERTPIDRDWLEEMMIASSSAAGLDLSDDKKFRHAATAHSNSVKSKSSRSLVGAGTH